MRTPSLNVSHKTLQRLIRKYCGIESIHTLNTLLEQHAPVINAHLPPELQTLLLQLPQFIQRIDANFCQFERDSELRTRSLELSSIDLSQANARLNHELEERNRAIASLGALAQTATGHKSATKTSRKNIPDDQNLIALSEAVTNLVTRLKSEQNEQIRLREQFERIGAGYQAVLNNLSEVVFRTDSRGRLIFTNQAWVRTIGLSEYDCMGKKLDEFIADSDVVKWRTAVSELLAGDRPHILGEYRLIRPDNVMVWTEVHVQPLMLDSHRISGMTGTFNDITERKQANDQLAQQLAFVDTLFQSLPVPAFVKDAQLRYVRFNQAYAQLFHLELDQAVGKTTQELGYVTETPYHQHHTKEALESDTPVVFESHMVLRNQIEMDAVVSKAALRDTQGNVIGLLGTFVDITSQKEMARATEHARRAAEAANRLKSDFLANMSHELRTPMNGIIGLTELLLDTPLDTQQKEYLCLVKQSSDSLMYLLNEILDLSKIEAGKMSLEQITFDLASLITEVMRANAPRVNQGNVRMALDIAPNIPSQIIGDPGRIRQILTNLVGNAAKFTEQGEIVTRLEALDTQGTQTRIRIAVQDTGIGISNDQLERIFAPFVQEDSSITRRFGGTGLGLTITHRLAQMMGGHIQVESQQGKGSIFQVELPIQIPNSEHNHPQKRHHKGENLKGCRFLLVDRDSSQSQILKKYLESIDCSVATATTLDDIQKIFHQKPLFDAIIIDSDLPQQRGAHLARDLLNQQKNLPPTFILTPVSTSSERYTMPSSMPFTILLTPASAAEIAHSVAGVIVKKPSLKPTQETLPSNNSLVSTAATSSSTLPARILLAEDNSVNQLLAKRILMRWNHQVTVANDGQEALNLFAENEFDVILMDMQMPFVSGIQACERIRSLEKNEGLRRTIIIALTANAMESDRQRCLDAGMDDYLSKPLHSADLQRMLEKYLPKKTDSAICAPSELPISPLASSEPSTFDYAQALNTANPEILSIIGEAFHQSCPTDLDKLQKACEQNNPIDVNRLAHTLKGLLSCFQAQPAAAIAEELEKIALIKPFNQTTSLEKANALTRETHTFLAALLRKIPQKPAESSLSHLTENTLS
jgi:PAS domain S-box-containing protein